MQGNGIQKVAESVGNSDSCEDNSQVQRLESSQENDVAQGQDGLQSSQSSDELDYDKERFFPNQLADPEVYAKYIAQFNGKILV